MDLAAEEMLSEQTVLLRRLTGQRQHVLDQLAGLSDEQPRRPVLPSGWSCLGLVRHLTLSDERYWFEFVVAGEPVDFWPEGDNGEWLVRPDESAEGWSRPTAPPWPAPMRSSPTNSSTSRRSTVSNGGPTLGCPFLTCAPSSCTSWSTPPCTRATLTPCASCWTGISTL